VAGHTDPVAVAPCHAAADLAVVLYDELRSLARRYLARDRNLDAVQPTALVHEAYLRLGRFVLGCFFGHVGSPV
jgi:hypothetical protein